MPQVEIGKIAGKHVHFREPRAVSVAVKRAMDSAASTVSRTACGVKSVLLAFPRCLPI